MILGEECLFDTMKLTPSGQSRYNEYDVALFFYQTVCSYHVMYTFQRDSTLCNCLKAKALPAQNRHHILSLSDCNGARTKTYLVCKQTLNHFPKLVVGSSPIEVI